MKRKKNSWSCSKAPWADREPQKPIVLVIFKSSVDSIKPSLQFGSRPPGFTQNSEQLAKTIIWHTRVHRNSMFSIGAKQRAPLHIAQRSRDAAKLRRSFITPSPFARGFPFPPPRHVGGGTVEFPHFNQVDPIVPDRASEVAGMVETHRVPVPNIVHPRGGVVVGLAVVTQCVRFYWHDGRRSVVPSLFDPLHNEGTWKKTVRIAILVGRNRIRGANASWRWFTARIGLNFISFLMQCPRSVSQARKRPLFLAGLEIRVRDID